MEKRKHFGDLASHPRPPHHQDSHHRRQPAMTSREVTAQHEVFGNFLGAIKSLMVNEILFTKDPAMQQTPPIHSTQETLPKSTPSEHPPNFYPNPSPASHESSTPHHVYYMYGSHGTLRRPDIFFNPASRSTPSQPLLLTMHPPDSCEPTIADRPVKVEVKSRDASTCTSLEHHSLPSHRRSSACDVSPRVKCQVCFKTYKNDDFLRYHTQKFHSNAVRPPRTQPLEECLVCHKFFANKYILATHEQRVHGINIPTFMCQHCMEHFSKKKYLKSHVEAKHGGPPTNRFECELCQKYYSNKYALATHQHKIHGEIYHFECKICRASFEKKKHLRNHSCTQNLN